MKYTGIELLWLFLLYSFLGWTLETAGELALLAGRGCRWLGRFLLALLLFLPWLVVGLVLWAQRRRGEGGE